MDDNQMCNYMHDNDSFTDIAVDSIYAGHSIVVSCAGYKGGYADVRLTSSKEYRGSHSDRPES